MGAIVDKLKADHDRLRDGAGVFDLVANAIGRVSADELSTLVDKAISFLRDELIPHDRREELVLQPLLCERMGGHVAGRTISRDHQEIEYLADELSLIRLRLATSPPAEADELWLRRALHALRTLVDLHFQKEEATAFPLLEADVSSHKPRALAPR